MFFVWQEVEEKAPVLMRQKEEYEHAVKTVENMSSKMEENVRVGFSSPITLGWELKNGFDWVLGPRNPGFKSKININRILSLITKLPFLNNS